MPRILTLTASALAGCLFLDLAVLAHSDAVGLVKQRMEAMSAMAKQMKAVGSMIKGETAFEPTTVSSAAQVMVQHGKTIPEQFPDNPESRGGRTEALPVIWQRWQRFSELAEQLVQQASVLEETAIDGTQEAVTRRFTDIAKTCRDCHSEFRKPKD